VSQAAAARSLMSIGEVLGQLRPDFPDVTISKIRFLESEGLVEPGRTASGYRKFSHNDVDRLRYVLRAQRDHYLPLRVIKEHLDAIDRGLEPPALPAGRPRTPRVVVAADGSESVAGDLGRQLRVSRAELAESTGLDEEILDQLEAFGFLGPRGKHYDASAVAVAQAVAELCEYGLEPRHLRTFRTMVEREVGLLEQVVAPLARGRGDDARARSEETAREMAAAFVRLHAAMVRTGLRDYLDR
jgi:DNA-binding transcriptional MerR regulator